MPETHTHVRALHPAPVSYLPARSRDRRVDLAKVRSPVRIAHAHPDEFEPCTDRIAGWRDAPRLHRNPDGIWRHLTYGGQAWPPVPSCKLVGYLEREGGQEAEIARALWETPANASARSKDEPRGRSIHVPRPYRLSASTLLSLRGVEVDLDSAREIRVDGRARAGAALQGYLDRDVRIVGGSVYVRQHEMLEARWTGNLYRWEAGANATEVRSGSLLATREGHAEVAAYIERNGDRHGPSGFDVGKWLELATPGGAPGEDVLRVANGSCLIVREAIDRCLQAIVARRPAFDALGRGLSALREEVREAEAWSWIGSFGRDDPAAALGFLARAGASALAAGREIGLPKGVTDALAFRMRDLRELYLPMAQPAPPPEDIECLAAAFR